MLTFPVLAFADDPVPRPPVGPGSAAAGGAHSILSLPDGRVFTWGKGSQGQLGLGDQRSRSTPTLATTLGNITMVAAGGAHSLARSSDGHVYAWGANGSGQLGDGSIATRRRPVLVPLIKDVVMVAAGRAHSLALTADGQVFAWGANDQGQLGLGATLDITVPTAITTLSGVIAIVAGHSHSLAITSTGELYAWGGNAHGQLGDGSRTARFTPIRITIGAVVAVAAGRSHTIALLSSGDVYSWGRGNSGQLGTGSVRFATSPTLIQGLKAMAIDAGGNFSAAIRHDRVLVTWGANRFGQLGDGTTVNRLRPVEVRGLAGISTISLGDAHVVAVTSNGSVWTWGNGKFGRLGNAAVKNETAPDSTMTGVQNWGPAIGTVEAPTIEPAGGLYHSAQAVTLKATGSFINIRYTLDGTAPTPESTPYVQPFVVSTAATVQARTFSTVSGDVSAVATAVFTFDYGQLAAPLFTPSGGTYTQAPLVAIASVAGATIRYTLSGDDPTESSAVYTAPIQIPAAGAQLKARAFHADWSPSAVVSESYVTDVTPPTIRADISPPLVDGWMTTPVTITFVCDDDSGQVTCPAPVVITEDGRDQLIRGTATDAAGNQASTSVIVSVDLHAPLIEAIDSPEGTSVSEPQITITAHVADAGSGVDQALCNGQPVPVVGEHAECLVMLRPGVNSVAIQARDAVGHLGSLGLTVNRIGTASSMTLSPAQRAMVVHEIATFSLRDDFGALVTGAEWSSSDAGIITLSTDDPPQVTAIGTGTASITAVKNGISTEAEITVHAVEIAPGTTRWTLKPTPGFEMDSPIFTTRVDENSPDLFAVETRTWGEATLHALTSEGEVLWRQESPGIPLLGDAFGGVIAGVLFDPEEGIDYRAYVRLGHAGGVMPWRHDSRGLLQAPAQAADGTIYATEYIDTGLRNSDNSKLWEKYAIILDGRTGARISSVQLERTRVTYTSQNDGTSGCRSTSVEKPPDTIGPVVDAAGRAYLLMHRLRIEKTDICNEPKNVRAARTIDVGVDLLVLEPGKPVITYSIYSAQCSSPLGGLVLCDAPVTVLELVPDGIGGVLAKWERASKVTPPSSVIQQMAISRLGTDGSIVENPVATHTWIYTVGQAGTAYLLGLGGYRAMDVTTWTPKWISSLGMYTPIAAHPDGGLAVQDEFNGLYQTVTSDGQLDDSSAMPLALKSPVQMFDSWIGVAPEGLRAVAGQFPDATRWHPIGGNAQRSYRQATPGIGIFAKAHLLSAIPYFMHMSIRITPQNPLPWRAHPIFGRYFHDYVDANGVTRPAVDIYGNTSATIGAGPDGPNGEDTTNFCLFNSILKSRPNRHRDQLETPSYQQQLTLRGSEGFYIGRLFELDGNYRDQLKYECVPDDPDEYNSNSYAAGLLGAADISKPWFPQRFPSMFPGWSKPVPSIYFRP